MKLIDRIGQKFGRLTVIERAENNRFGNTRWVCLCDCGERRTVVVGDLLSDKRGTKSCGCLAREVTSNRMKSMTGCDHHSWKGGRSTNKQGYVEVHRSLYEDTGIKGRCLEHRIVMARHLGRPLTESEEVHHRNGIRDDNRIENLELKASPHGPKISIDDAIIWARDIISKYDPIRYYPEDELCL